MILSSVKKEIESKLECLQNRKRNSETRQEMLDMFGKNIAAAIETP